MNNQSWQLPEPIEAISFDCDSTLSSIEGIDELAKFNGCESAVNQLTEEAMSTTGLNEALYTKRLNLVKPTLQQSQQLAQSYYDNLSKDLEAVITVFHALNKSIYIISAGHQPSVSLFAQKLNLSQDNTFAVQLFFHENGHYHDYDHSTPLTKKNGKNTVIKKLKEMHKNLIHIGDGINDIETKNEVTRFIGYGGHVIREKVLNDSQFYVSCQSMLPLLPLCLTAEEAQNLDRTNKDHYEQGLELLNQEVRIKD